MDTDNKELTELEPVAVDMLDENTEQAPSATAKKYAGIGPKRLFKLGYMEGDGWREGFTKPSLDGRKAARRAKNKKARKSRARHRK